MAIVRYIKGDITETDIKYIAHGVNCMDKMGSGVAKALFTKWPKVKEAYHLMTTGGDETQLGKMCGVGVERGDKHVFNLYTQYNYGPGDKRYVNYAAIGEAFKTLANTGIGHLAIPKIGCGLAGGDWKIVEQIINDAVGDKLNITVYYL